jgi:enediyne biosynthesis protein E4
MPAALQSGRWLSWAMLCALGGCSESGVSTSGDHDASGGELVLEPGPVVLDTPAAVDPGGLLYVVVDAPISRIGVEIDGQPLGPPVDHPQGDLAAALYRVPDDLPLGAATLAVRTTDPPSEATELALELREGVFADVGALVGLDHLHDVTDSPIDCAESHTGLAFGDFDGDGLPDVFVGNVGAEGKLYRNRGSSDAMGLPAFEEITAQAGLAGVDAVASATFIDYDGDGDLDLYIGRRGPNRLLRNRMMEDGVARFEDVTSAVGLGIEDQRTLGIAFGDYDGDGDLDLYVVNHAYCFPKHTSEIRARDHLYRNDDGVFVERTLELGPVVSSVGFSAVWIDVDRDGDQDLLVINDDIGGIIGWPNALWRNDGPGEQPGAWRFEDVSASSGVAIPGVNGMGLALGDLDGDGFVDLAFTNIGRNVLLRNAGDGTFVDVSESAGIERARLPWERSSITWAAHLLDFDNDGDLDLYFSGGPIKGTAAIPDAMFENLGDGTFADITWWAGVADPAHGKASAIVDLDRDGFFEFATAAWGGPLRVYHNRFGQRSDHHWLVVELEGRPPNRSALGAVVRVEPRGRAAQTCFHTSRPSLGAGGELACHFGLGSANAIDGVEITWPDGTVDRPEPPPVDRRVRIVQN